MCQKSKLTPWPFLVNSAFSIPWFIIWILWSSYHNSVTALLITLCVYFRRSDTLVHYWPIVSFHISKSLDALDFLVSLSWKFITFALFLWLALLSHYLFTPLLLPILFKNSSSLPVFSVNIGCGPAEERVLLTGLHAVADIYCEICKTTLGWKYVSNEGHFQGHHGGGKEERSVGWEGTGREGKVVMI